MAANHVDLTASLKSIQNRTHWISALLIFITLVSAFPVCADSAPESDKATNEVTAHLSSGVNYAQQGNLGQSIAEFTEALKLNPKSAFAYYWRGLVSYQNNDYEKAISDSTQAIALDPKYAEALCVRAAAYNGKGSYQLAIADCNQALTLRVCIKSVMGHSC